MNASLLGLSLSLVCMSLFAEVVLPMDKAKFKIVVLAGQSNMAGRGAVTEADATPHPRVVMMDVSGNWVPCKDPIHFDKRTAGVGPGKTFAEALAESDPSITVGVVPCAVGGTMISAWLPDAPPMLWNRRVKPPVRVSLYQNAVDRVRKAQEKGTLAAILWHQGESDHVRGPWFAYQALFPIFLEAFRRDLHAEGVPVICGGLHPSRARTVFGEIHAATQRWACEYAFGPGAFVPCPEDCVLNRDKLHFSRDSQVEFGKQYFAAYCKVAKALAANGDFWKDPASDAAKIKPHDIADWPADDVSRQWAAVPAVLPVAVESWLFPDGRPAMPRQIAEDVAP